MNPKWINILLIYFFLFCDAEDTPILYFYGAGFNSKTSHIVRISLAVLSSFIQDQRGYFKFEHVCLLSLYLQGNIHREIGRYVVRKKNSDVK